MTSEDYLVQFHRAKKFIWERLKNSNFSGLPDATIKEFQAAIDEYADFLAGRLSEVEYSRPSPSDVRFAVQDYEKDCVKRFVKRYKSMIFLKEELKKIDKEEENEYGHP